MAAAESGEVDSLAVLLERGATKRRQSKDGRIALHYAAQKGTLECLVMLLQASARKWDARTDANAAL